MKTFLELSIPLKKIIQNPAPRPPLDVSSHKTFHPEELLFSHS
jgi:hypothetical protein